MRLTRFQLYSLLVGGLLFSMVLNESADGQGPGGGKGNRPDGGGGGGKGNRGGTGFPGGNGFGGNQGGGQGRNRGDGGGGGGGNFDPNTIFNRISNGADTIQIDAYIQMAKRFDANAEERINSFVQRNGISNGQLTREQFALLFQEGMAQRGGGQNGRRGGGTPLTDDQIKEWFDRLDVNKDGALQPEEMPPDLKTNLNQWDKDGNGSISLEEFTAYAKSLSNRNGGQGGYYEEEEPAEENKRQLVYRANNLPKELPAWFGQLDRDKDGQVSLYEWKAAGRGVEEFLKYDMNGDGFLTIDEILRYEARNKPAAGSAADAFAVADFGNGQRPGGFNRGGTGGPGGFNRGTGGSGNGPGGFNRGGAGGSGNGPGGFNRGGAGGSRDQSGGGRGMRQPQGEEEE